MKYVNDTIHNVVVVITKVIFAGLAVCWETNNLSCNYNTLVCHKIGEKSVNNKASATCIIGHIVNHSCVKMRAVPYKPIIK